MSLLPVTGDQATFDVFQYCALLGFTKRQGMYPACYTISDQLVRRVGGSCIGGLPKPDTCVAIVLAGRRVDAETKLLTVRRPIDFDDAIFVGITTCRGKSPEKWRIDQRSFAW